jgi:G-rich domain on putative tyrosine kinase
VAVLLTLLVSLALPTRWTAKATFIPETSSSIQLPQGVGALAGEFGLTLPGSDPMSSPDFYAAVTRSRSLLEQTLTARFPVPGAARRGDSLPLIDILEIEADTPRERMEKAVEWLKDHSSARVDNKTGTIELAVELPGADLSATVARHMVGLLNDFNQHTRNLRARERRKFTEGRAEAAQKDLLAAEEALRIFLTRNRQFETSPQLLFEHGRLQRQVDLRQEVYQTLRREYEVARIDEVNDTPVLTVVDPPAPPAKPSSPRPLRMSLVAAVLGLLLGVTLAFVLEYLNRSREQQPAAYQRVVEVWRRRRRRAAAGVGS